MKLEQAVLSNACHENGFFITVLLRLFSKILVESINYIHTHTRIHSCEQSIFLIAFNFVLLLLSIHVHVCTDARKQTNSFDVEQNTF